MALDISAEIEAFVSVAAVALNSLSASDEGMLCGSALALSMRISLGLFRLWSDSWTLLIALSRLLSSPFSAICSMDEERSKIRMTVSILDPPQPRNPPTRGRAIAKMSAAIASARQVRMMMYLSFFLPLDSREAFSRNSIAAHCTVR